MPLKDFLYFVSCFLICVFFYRMGGKGKYGVVKVSEERKPGDILSTCFTCSFPPFITSSPEPFLPSSDQRVRRCTTGIPSSITSLQLRAHLPSLPNPNLAFLPLTLPALHISYIISSFLTTLLSGSVTLRLLSHLVISSPLVLLSLTCLPPSLRVIPVRLSFPSSLLFKTHPQPPLSSPH